MQRIGLLKFVTRGKIILQNNKKITTVLFDAGGILFTAKTARNDRIRNILKSLDVKEEIIELALLKGDEFLCKFNESGEWLNNWSEEKVFFQKYYSNIANVVGSNDNYLNEKLFHLTHYVNHCTLYPEVIDVLKELSKYYNLGVISNANPSLEWVFDKLDIRKYFHSITISAFVGKAKPDKMIYNFALEKSSYKAEECLFIDNKIVNIEAARELGMQGIYINRKNNEDLNLVKKLLL